MCIVLFSTLVELQPEKVVCVCVCPFEFLRRTALTIFLKICMELGNIIARKLTEPFFRKKIILALKWGSNPRFWDLFDFSEKMALTIFFKTPLKDAQ